MCLDGHIVTTSLERAEGKLGAEELRRASIREKESHEKVTENIVALHITTRKSGSI